MNSSEAEPKRTGEIGTTAVHWFVRGLAGGVMLIAAGNALSYFFRTASIADLIGSDRNVTEAIGFPFEIWRENSVYGGLLLIDYWMTAANLLVGVLLGSLFGMIAVKLRHHFNRWVEEFERKQSASRKLSFQFSMKSLLVMTTIAALFIATLTRWKGTSEVLVAIYFFGPISLILIAMMPKRIHWYHRIVILTVTAFSMIGIAIWSGLIMQVPIDRVLLGIFVCWTPQSAIAAFLLTVGLIVQMFWNSPLPKQVGSA